MGEIITLQMLGEEFIAEKKALGYKFISDSGIIRRFIRKYTAETNGDINLSKEAVLEYTKKLFNQTDSTVCRNITVINRFSEFLNRRGYKAYIVPAKMLPKLNRNFKARIFNDEEILRLLTAANSIDYAKQNPLKMHQMPVMFSILINCGMREAELLNLRVCDVDLNENVFTILDTKFHKNRYVPFSTVVADEIKRYLAVLKPQNGEDLLLPSPKTGGRYNNSAVNLYFRLLLRLAGIPHEGHGKGPRPHDLRHTFAVHCLNSWALSGVDLSIALPVLSRYMGHSGLSGTQKYLQLTAQMYPDILKKLEEKYGGIVPTREVAL